MTRPSLSSAVDSETASYYTDPCLVLTKLTRVFSVSGRTFWAVDYRLCCSSLRWMWTCRSSSISGHRRGVAIRNVELELGVAQRGAIAMGKRLLTIPCIAIGLGSWSTATLWRLASIIDTVSWLGKVRVCCRNRFKFSPTYCNITNFWCSFSFRYFRWSMVLPKLKRHLNAEYT